MKYPLLPYSQLVFDMLKTNPEVYMVRFGVRIDKKNVDVLRLKNAIRLALCNHPIFSMRVDAEGMQYYESQLDIFQGMYHSINFCDEGESVCIEVAYNRILGDTKSELIFYEDVIRAYQGLPLLPDYYLEYLERMMQYRKIPRYEKNRRALEGRFDALTCPVHPKTDISLKAEVKPVEGLWLEDYGTLNSKLSVFSQKQVLPLTAIVSLASALAIMAYNETDEAALTWAYEGRETEDEQRIFGSLHRDIPFHIRKSTIENQESAIRETRKQYREGIAYSTYPYTLTSPHSEIWNYALNVLVRPIVSDMKEAIPFPIESLPIEGDNHLAYALLDVEIHKEADSLRLLYRYSATHYKESSIRRFASLVRKYVEWLLEE